MHLTILVWKHASSGPTWAYIHVTECLCQQQYMYRLIGPTTQPEKVVRSGSAACDMADRQSAKVLKKASSPPREGSTLSWQYKGGGGGGAWGRWRGGSGGGGGRCRECAWKLRRRPSAAPASASAHAHPPCCPPRLQAHSFAISPQSAAYSCLWCSTCCKCLVKLAWCANPKLCLPRPSCYLISAG